jgi:RHS repeat-associated protein
MTNRVSRNALACALLASTSLCFPAIAHAESPAPPFTSVDDHGVDVISGLPFLAIEEGGIGSGQGRISMQRIWAAGAGFQDNWSGGLYRITTSTATKMVVQTAGFSETFTSAGPGSDWTSEKARGGTLTVDVEGTGDWIYTSRDGTTIRFGKTIGGNGPYCPGGDAGQCRIPLSIAAPTGLRFNLSWEEIKLSTVRYRRLVGVSSSAGYSATIAYVTNNPGPGPSPVGDWWNRSLITFNNSANPPSPAPTISYAYPSSTALDATDPAGRTWHWEKDSSGRLTGVRRPGSASNNISYHYHLSDTVTAATHDGVTNNYSRGTGSTPTITITSPVKLVSVTVDLRKTRVTQFQDSFSRIWSFEYDSNSRLTRITPPEGNYVEYAYDARGNVTTTTRHGGRLVPDLVTSAAFDLTCTNAVKCNKPNSSTDAKGNVTDYTYDPVHGGVLTVTQPAPTTGAIRPQTRYSYLQITSASGDPVYMLAGVSACQTTGSCTGSADETKITASYNSNLLPTSATRGSGSGTLTATTTATYDARGNVDTVDGPLTGIADTTKYRYDAADQRVGVTSPDPDGAGALKMRATRLTYRPDGQVSKQELGTVNSQSDADWASFVPMQTVDVTFDTNSRPTQKKLSAGGTAYALTQTSYDAGGRVDCTAVRMNTAVYGSLPAGACTLSTQGSDGPDRIGKIVYDALGRVVQVQEGVGTTDAATERTLTYTDNGLMSTLKDAENNLTTYEYDGFDRLSKTRYPSPNKGGGTSSTTDYEQLGYDANGNVTSRRLRDGTTIAFTFNNLDRVTLKDRPGTEPDVTYAYDNLGRVTSASQTGSALSFTYDALDRKLTETGPQGAASSQYDIAGRRTQLTYPGTGLFVNTDYLVTGEVTNVRENGATSGVGVLATYAYDDLGNLTSRTSGNGVVQNYTHDPVSRLASLTNDLSSTTNDLLVTFGNNPASQISGTTRNGDAYAFNGLVTVDRTYTSNGRNQYAAAGPASFSYDARGNLTSDGTNSYGYSSENLLTSASGPTPATLAYDPAMRLSQISATATTRFAYDGVNNIAEYDGSNALLRRHVFGPGTDEQIVSYEGTGTTDRRFMSSDERGSIISLTDSSGAPIAINRYDEYGIPGSANDGRFQYTGQAWLKELGMSYYKARMYSPTLGRFMQTDPIGQADDLNLYAYAGNDPVNLIDPTGTYWVPKLRCAGYEDNCGVYGYTWVPDGSWPGGDGPGSGGSIGGGGTGGGGSGGASPPPPPQPQPQPKPKPQPKPSKKRSQCAAAVVGAGVEGILSIGTEGILAAGTVGEIAAGGLAIAAGPALLLGGITVGVVTVVAVGTYYNDQKGQNAVANSLNQNFGLCG